jgi:hypothetical protein
MQESQNNAAKVTSLDDLGLKVLSPLEQNHIMGGDEGDNVETTVTVTVTVTVTKTGDEAQAL